MDENVLLMAEALTRAEVEEGVNRARSELLGRPKTFDGPCIDCGEKLAESRLSFGAIRCVPCQTIHEQRASIKRGVRRF